MNEEYQKEMKEYRESMAIYEAELAQKNKAALEFVAANINYPLEIITDILDEITWEHEGYVKVEKSDYKNGFYPSYDFYTEQGDSKGYKYMRQDDDGEFHTMVWQTTGMSGDDYSGFMLFPLKNGDYWKINFSC
jgi:hypothetical protein